MPVRTAPLQIGEPPKWLVSTLFKHQNAVNGMCTCSYADLDAHRMPKRFVSFSPEHQAEAVHSALAQSIIDLVNEGNTK